MRHDPNKLKLPGDIPFWGTWPHGAITVHSQRKHLWVETFGTGQRLVLDADKDQK